MNPRRTLAKLIDVLQIGHPLGIDATASAQHGTSVANDRRRGVDDWLVVAIASASLSLSSSDVTWRASV